MKIHLYKNDNYKKSRYNLFKHILKNYLKLDFSHGVSCCYEVDNNDSLNGRYTSIGCHCGEEFWVASHWEKAHFEQNSNYFKSKKYKN